MVHKFNTSWTTIEITSEPHVVYSPYGYDVRVLSLINNEVQPDEEISVKRRTLFGPLEEFRQQNLGNLSGIKFKARKKSRSYRSEYEVELIGINRTTRVSGDKIKKSQYLMYRPKSTWSEFHVISEPYVVKGTNSYAPAVSVEDLSDGANKELRIGSQTITNGLKELVDLNRGFFNGIRFKVKKPRDAGYQIEVVSGIRRPSKTNVKSKSRNTRTPSPQGNPERNRDLATWEAYCGDCSKVTTFVKPKMSPDQIQNPTVASETPWKCELCSFVLTL